MIIFLQSEHGDLYKVSLDQNGSDVLGITVQYFDTIAPSTQLTLLESGYLFAAGRAGGRFAVRNSGATAVVEGCSANGCEYMTGGTVVILGAFGDNFAAGMTGGRAYVLDEKGVFADLVNEDSVIWRGFDEGDGEEECLALIRRHAEETKSARAAAILSDWPRWRALFVEVEPKEILALKRRKMAAE